MLVVASAKPILAPRAPFILGDDRSAVLLADHRLNAKDHAVFDFGARFWIVALQIVWDLRLFVRVLADAVATEAI